MSNLECLQSPTPVGFHSECEDVQQEEQEEQEDYNPTLILNPSLQSSVDVRDRPSY